MTAQIIRLEPSAHRALQDLLPWFATGTLSPEEARSVAEHLEGCAECQAELEWHRELATHVDPVLPADQVQHSWLRLLPALEASTPLMEIQASRPRQRWVPWALAAQLVLLVGFGTIAFTGWPSTPALYRGLSAAATPTFRLVLMVEPQTPELELRTLVRSAGLRIVDGPTPNGAYVLEGNRTDEATALRVLRASRAALMVEPLEGRSTGRDP